MTDNDRIMEALTRRFPNNTFAPKYYGDLLVAYLESGLSPPHLVSEIATGDEHKLWSAVWEAMLYQHLHSGGYALRNNANAAGQNGPDFGIDHDGNTIWIEAVVPEPKGIPERWLAPPGEEIRVRSKPDDERVLRCTSVLADKQKRFHEYQGKGIVGAHDRLIIAVNICRLSDFDIDGAGISQMPLAMEPLFGFGPLAIRVTRDGQQVGQAQHVPRFDMTKPSGANVKTAYFYDPAFSRISAVIQAHQKYADEHAGLILQTIHNPNAANPLATGLFHARTEYVAELRGDDCLITNILAA